MGQEMLSRYALIVLCVCFLPTDAFAADLGTLNHDEFLQRRQLLSQELASWYEPSYQPQDKYIVGDTVSIDQPIFSNGGNIFILANKLILNAPLDTRFYFVEKGPFWLLPERGDPGTGALSGLHAMTEPNNAMFQSFASLIEWTEYYDFERKTFSYRLSSERVDPKNPWSTFNSWQNWKRRAPQKPSAYVSRAGDSTRYDAPNVDQNTSRSGSITIFAGQIEYCEKCGPETPVTVERGDVGDLAQKLLFQVSGVKGGRGGVGAPPICGLQPANYEGCGSSHEPGGLSGLPSSGGDAGDISINIMVGGKAPSEANLLALSSVSGGRPAHDRRYAVGNRLQLRDAADRTAPAFVLQGDVIQNLFGKDGTAVVRKVDFSTAFAEIATLLSVDSVSRPRDTLTTFTAANTAGRTQKQNLRRLLTSFLQQTLVGLERSTIAEYGDHGLDAPKSTNPLRSKAFFAKLDCSKPLTLASYREVEILSALCFFDFDNKNRVLGFLGKSAGILNSNRPNISDAVKAEALASELTAINGNLGKVIDELKQVNEELFKQRMQQQQAAIQARISDLQNKLLNVKEKTLSLGQQLGAIGQLAQAAGAAAYDFNILYSAVPAFLEYFGDGDVAEGMGKKVGKSFASFGKLEDAARAVFDTSQDSQTASRQQLTQALSEAKLAFSALGLEIAATLEKVAAARSITLKDVVRAQERTDNAELNVTLLFPEMLKASAVSSLEKAGAAANSTGQMANIIESLLVDFPQNHLQFPELEQTNPCQGGNKEVKFSDYLKNPKDVSAVCLIVDVERPSDALLVYEISSLQTIPLFALRAGKEPVRLPISWSAAAKSLKVK